MSWTRLFGFIVVAAILLFTIVAVLSPVTAATGSGCRYGAPSWVVCVLNRACLPLGSATYLGWSDGRCLPWSREIPIPSRPSGTQVGESAQCVAAVKTLTGAPQTALWRRGPQVMSSRPPCGTAIAVFQPDGRYSQTGAGHTAILAAVCADGIWVFDQNWGSPSVVRRHFIRTTGSGGVGDAGAYYIITR